MKAQFLKRPMIFILSLTALCFSCSDSENTPEETEENAHIKLSITDAPIDDINVEAAFVSFAGLEIDGQAYMFDNIKTIELSALTNGKKETLFDQKIEAETFNDIKLLLSFDMDAQGNSPGCYILTTEGTKDDLFTNNVSNQKLTLPFKESVLVSSEIIVDFDLRKAIEYNSEIMEDSYRFTSMLNQCLRTVGEENMKIAGTIKDEFQLKDDKLIVYAYEKGSFNAEKETGGTVESRPMFASSVSSSLVDAGGNFELHFLPKGEYTIKIVNYKQNELGQMKADAFLEANALTSLNLLGIKLDSDVFLNISIGEKKEI